MRLLARDELMTLGADERDIDWRAAWRAELAKDDQPSDRRQGASQETLHHRFLTFACSAGPAEPPAHAVWHMLSPHCIDSGYGGIGWQNRHLLSPQRLCAMPVCTIMPQALPHDCNQPGEAICNC